VGTKIGNIKRSNERIMAERTVAIYARVSTEHEAQISALENQVQYYDNILAMHPDWIVYDRYIDEGITGTSTKKRKQFMAMMKDAENGCFDLILTREVSRFARNTVDTLQETRKLKKIGVEVYFTEDNIWTMNDEDGELRLTLMATLAQNESKKTSLRVKAGQMVSFQNGVPYGNGNILGYDRVGKEFIVNPEQAETVRLIYDLYLNGYGARKIQFELEKRKRRTATGLTNWSPSNISRILRNSFYCGVIEYRKQYVPDYLEQKKINNHGAVERILVEGNHEPIISKETFEQVRRIVDSKTASTDNRGKRGKKLPDSVWCRKLICECGHQFNRKVWHTNKEGIKQFSFQCYSSIRTGTVRTRMNKGLSVEGVCDIPMIQDWKLELMAKEIFDRIWCNKENVLAIANQLLESSISEKPKKNYDYEIKQQEVSLEKQRTKLDNLVDMRLSNEIPREMYQKKRTEIEGKIDELQEKIENCKNANNESEDGLDKKVEALKKAMEQDFNFDTSEIPESIIDAFVDHIKVYKDKFVWKINLLDENVTCLASGTRKKHDVSIVDFPSSVHSSTGSYRK
jgi:DNA invertase Pin-like site-specific DNA recombinase